MYDDNHFDNIDGEFTSEKQGPAGQSRKKRGKQQKDLQKKQSDTFRVRLFKVFYAATKERNTDLFQAWFLMLVMFIQIYDLIISPIMKFPFSGALYQEVSGIFDTIRIYPAIVQSKNVDAYWFFMNKSIAVIVIYCVKLVLLDFTLRKKKYRMNWPIQLLQIKSAFIFWIYLIPATDFFISIYECNDQGFHKIDHTLECWTAKHSFMCALYSISLIAFIVVAILISLLYNESRPYYTDALTRTDINNEIYLTLYRVILTVVSHYTDTKSYHWLVLALHMLMSLHLIKNYQKYLPYYYDSVSTLYGACCLGYLWVTCNAILVKALESVEYRGQIIVIVVGFLFMYPAAHLLRQSQIKKIVQMKNTEKIKNDLELDQFVTNFQKLLQASDQNEEIEMMFLGFLYLHREECQSSICPLKSTDDLYLPLSDNTSVRDHFPSKDVILHQHLLNSVFLDYQKAHPNTQTAVMHTSYAHFLFFQMGNVHMSLIELNLAGKQANTLQQEFTVYKMKQVIEESLILRFRQTSKSGNHMITQGQVNLQSYADLDVTIVITFEGLFTRLEKQIEQSASDHIEFWSHLDSNMIDLNVINKLGLNIINQTKKVNEIWNMLIKINPNYPNALYIYGNYLSQIKNDHEQGDEYRNHYHQVKRLKSLDDYENQFDLMFAEDTTVIIMNGSKEQQGKIIKTNQGIFKLFGYSMFEVQGHDVNILMPPVIALKHQTFIDKYFRTGKDRIINNCLESFAMYRTGIIFPVHLVVKQVPSLRNDIQYIGMIKRANRDYEYILTDENGKIDSISEGITSLLKLPISFFKDHDIPIQVLIPELCEVSRMKLHSSEPVTNFEAWNGLKDLRFMVPKNLSSSNSRGGAATGTSIRNMDATSEDGVSGTGTGTGTQTQTSSSSKNMKHLGGLMVPSQQQTFVGLKSSDSLKIISNMFKNAEHKSTPEKYKTNLLNHVNYINPDFDKMLKTDMMFKRYSDGELKIKVFKIFYSKKKKHGINRRFSEHSSQNLGNGGQTRDEETMLHQFGMSGMSALNDKYIFQKYKELIQNAKTLDKQTSGKRIAHDIEVLKVLLDRQKKVRTNGNIMTPEEYENAELDRMKRHIEQLEQQISDYNSETSKGTNRHPFGGGGHGVNTDTSSMGILKNQQLSHSFQGNSGNRTGNNNGTEDDTSGAPSKITIGSFLNSFGNNDQHKKIPSAFSPKFRQEHNMDGTTQNAEEIDEEDQKTKEKRRKKKDKNKHRQIQVEGADEDEDTTNNQQDLITSKSKRVKEDPRRDFVNDFFKQNLNQSTLQVSNNASKKDMTSKMKDQKSAFQMDWQNDILRNLQDKTKLKRDMSSKPQDSPDNKQQTSTEPQKEEANQDKHQTAGHHGDASSIKVALDDTGSVASDTKSLLRHLRILRNALYENYVPQSIQNLKYSARFVLLVLLSMTIASFIFSQQKYNHLKENFYNIESSQQRMQSITGILTATRMSGLINNGTVNRYRYGQGQDYFAKMQKDINDKAILLQDAQMRLSITEFDFSDENEDNINAQEVLLYYNTAPEVGLTQTVNIWSTVMQLSINAFKLKDLSLSDFKTPFSTDDTDEGVSMQIWFVLRNSMNNILSAVSESTQGLLDDTKILSQENKQILMILLIVASGCLLASMLIIMPVVTKVHQDKDKLLSLFLLIDQQDVKEQLKRCKDFFTTFHNDDKGGLGGGGQGMHGDPGFEFDDEGKEGEENNENKAKDGKTPSSDEVKKEEEQKKDAHRNRFTRKNKKLKKYSTNYMMLLLKFLVVIAILESYFLYQYFQSENFLNRSLDMIKEAASITNRNFNNFLLYQIIIEILATNGTAKVFNKRSTEYIVGYLDEFNQELENFLKVHSDNVQKHDDEFNTFFDSLIYQSVCQSIDTYFTPEERAGCSSYLGGVLEKGLYSANLAFWDDMREIRDSYFKSDKSQSYMKTLINSERLIQDEKLNEIYFFKAYSVLMEKQNQSINVQFDNRNKEVMALFSIYLLLLILMYFILWGRFVESMRHSLWVTKSMLAIIPLEVIEKVKVIKDFLMTTSRAAMNSLKE